MKIKKFLAISVATISVAGIATYATAQVIPGEIDAVRIDTSGDILINVDDSGKAFYVDPVTLKRTSLGSPEDAFSTMRDFGLGVSNNDIAKIPIAIPDNFDGPDSDQDTIPDFIEDAIGTDPNNSDSDGDGFPDRTEIDNNFDPLGPGPMPVDPILVDRLDGHFILQVEDNGQAFFVKDGKRTFLGRPSHAHKALEDFGRGINQQDIDRIPVNDGPPAPPAFDRDGRLVREIPVSPEDLRDINPLEPKPTPEQTEARKEIPVDPSDLKDIDPLQPDTIERDKQEEEDATKSLLESELEKECAKDAARIEAIKKELDALDKEYDEVFEEEVDRIDQKQIECDEFPTQWNNAFDRGASNDELDAIVRDHNECLDELEDLKREPEDPRLSEIDKEQSELIDELEALESIQECRENIVDVK